ncbi:hypothetical protein GCM10023084_74440 [Streptomyces lacrimifluminis]|uniref:Aldo/keto reductase n=1 Tax=Streptomyces lacrimifluminis TaxID=1500077 RepID=A0A917UKV3_9ACTN|nr:hypothetical protein [Streptomyces lacrimifluminis]GGJ64882.1 hypothetical protein GCM10012282_72510 [Streptomyces lacrimifluminis]
MTALRQLGSSDLEVFPLALGGNVFGWTADETQSFEDSLDLSDREGLARYVAVQPYYNLVSRDTYEGSRRDIASRTGLAADPYYALASGFLTGKYRAGTAVDSPRAQGAARPTVAAPIASARTVDQLPPLLAVAELELTEAEVASLTVASA